MDPSARPFETQSLLRDDSINPTVATPETRTGINIKNGVIPMKNSMRSVLANDAKFQNMFLSPLMSKLEEAVAKNMKSLDELEDGQAIETILGNLDKLLTILNEPSNDPSELDTNQKSKIAFFDSSCTGTTDIQNVSVNDFTKISQLDRLNEIICLASSINTYLRTVNNGFYKNENINQIPKEIYSNVNLWLSRLFRFHNTNCVFHQHDYESIIYMAKLIMQIKYEKLKNDGFKVYSHSEPVFYVSSASKFAKIEYRQKICALLGLPLESLKPVRVCTKFSSSYDKIDAPVLVDEIEKDIEEKRVPQLLIANAGSYNVGQCDNLVELERICRYYRIWLHLDGVHLSTLVLFSVPSVLQPVNSGDSISLDFGNWIGVPSLSHVTLFKETENAGKIMELYQDSWDCLDKSLPYWCLLQAIGHEGVVERIKHATSLTKTVVDTINRQQPFLKIISFRDDPDEQVVVEKKYTFQELIAKALTFITLVELNNSIVIFKCNDNYIKDTLYRHNSELRYDTNDEKNEIILNEYCCTLTSWLCDLLNSVHRSIRLDMIEIKEEGLCLRYSPVEHANILHTREEDLQQFLKSFEDVLKILDASIKCRAMFSKKLTQCTNLKHINVSQWAGVGAVRYIPSYLMDKLDKQDEQFKLESNKINSELVRSLQAHDDAYSLAQTEDGFLGVKFGMVNEVEALDKLINEVQQVGKSIEESEKFLETVTELVRQGIEKANQDLRKEKEDKVYQDGVLRQIPLVGGLVNWWSPKEQTSVVGRQFHLKSGKIESTETIYKYHMQIQENDNAEPNKIDNYDTASVRSDKSSTDLLQAKSNNPNN